MTSTIRYSRRSLTPAVLSRSSCAATSQSKTLPTLLTGSTAVERDFAAMRPTLSGIDGGDHKALKTVAQDVGLGREPKVTS
jgi:hypothetical protein